MRTAIAIIGGGILGSVLAGFLAEAGEEVTLIDGGGPGGSSANAGSLHVQMQSRFMRLYPEHVPGMERQLPLYPRAVRFWKALEEKLGADFDLKMKGGLMVAERLIARPSSACRWRSSTAPRSTGSPPISARPSSAPNFATTRASSIR